MRIFKPAHALVLSQKYLRHCAARTSKNGILMNGIALSRADVCIMSFSAFQRMLIVPANTASNVGDIYAGVEISSRTGSDMHAKVLALSGISTF